MLGPRRLAHANLFVTDWQRSLKFYQEVCGLQEVFREPDIRTGFLSNGNTSHDLACAQISATGRIGRGGFVQTPAGAMSSVALNHFGIEMENEAELVEAFDRLRAADIKIDRLTDSDGLSKSIYLSDPDGVGLQFYADTLTDWRGFWNLGPRLVTGGWNPKEKTPTRQSHYTPKPEFKPYPGGIFQPTHITGATLYVEDLERSRKFYTEVAGFEEIHRAEGGRASLFSAKKINRDLMLLAAEGDQRAGLRHFTLEVPSLEELVAGYRRLLAAGLKAEATLDHEIAKSVYIRDPDGFLVELTANTGADWKEFFRKNPRWIYPEGRPWRPEAK
jgi:catechol 2,3-dioxygenase